MTAEPIVEQSIEDAPTTEHQSMLDRIHSVLSGAWHALEGILPDHDLKDVVLNNVKQAYDNAAKVVKDDLAKVTTTAVSAGEDAAQAVVQGAESVVESTGQELASEAATGPSEGSATTQDQPQTSSPESDPASTDSPTAEVPAQAAPAEDGTSVPSA